MKSERTAVEEEDGCIICVEVWALGKIRLTDFDVITINNLQESNAGGWTLQQVIERAAYPTSGRGYAEWHSRIFLEAFEQNGLDFTVGFGS